MGHTRPNALTEMRRVKAEGGWGTVCAEFTDIHPSSDLMPHTEGRLWDDEDTARVSKVVEAIHSHGSLAGIELGHLGLSCANLESRLPSLAPSHRSVLHGEPYQARAMSLSDIREFRHWHKKAALRSKQAGFDIIYVYAAHNLSLLQHFLLPRYNCRADEYGGSLENRVRLLREVLEDTKDAVGDKCAVALRLAVDELMGDDGLRCDAEGREIVEMLAELPDLWDVNTSSWDNDSQPSRFASEGFQEPYISFVKRITSKPVVGVGRYTNPDTMVRLIKSGVIDLIGAARPSIADPFLPLKVKEGRAEDIRECIGCNVCVSADINMVPIRCTQNPTMGEEWRRGWHPERMNPKRSDGSVLVVGSGPAGLEAALALSTRGYDVALAEATTELGGRVIKESALPGLSEWRRVADYRIHQLLKRNNVQIYRDSRLTPDEIVDFGFEHVLLATGSTWRKDAVGRTHYRSPSGLNQIQVFTPDDLMAGNLPRGEVILFDDDNYYMGGALAELLARSGSRVKFVTSSPQVAPTCIATFEQFKTQANLINLEVEIHTDKRIDSLTGDSATLKCVYTGRETRISGNAVVLVTDRLPNEDIYLSLTADQDRLKTAGIKTLRAIGDSLVPGIIATAVFSGHTAARELEETEGEILYRRERSTVYAS